MTNVSSKGFHSFHLTTLSIQLCEWNSAVITAEVISASKHRNFLHYRYQIFTLSLLSAILPSETPLIPNGRIAKENNRTLNIVVIVNA